MDRLYGRKPVMSKRIRLRRKYRLLKQFIFSVVSRRSWNSSLLTFCHWLNILYFVEKTNIENNIVRSEHSQFSNFIISYYFCGRAIRSNNRFKRNFSCLFIEKAKKNNYLYMYFTLLSALELISMLTMSALYFVLKKNIL